VNADHAATAARHGLGACDVRERDGYPYDCGAAVLWPDHAVYECRAHVVWWHEERPS
jgi:hypothetical protein